MTWLIKCTCGNDDRSTNPTPKLDPPKCGKVLGRGTRVRCFMLKEYAKGLWTVSGKKYIPLESEYLWY